jgi:EAL domain-containing protein (putative c-di-GMP-specific phosphodiesterase class I)
VRRKRLGGSPFVGGRQHYCYSISPWRRAVATAAASQHVVKAVVNLAKDFGQQTIAEGVEDERTLDLVRELGVDFAQGYYIGRPGPLATAGLLS